MQQNLCLCICTMPGIFQELQSNKRREIQWEKDGRKHIFCVPKKLKTILLNDNLSIFKGIILPICLLSQNLKGHSMVHRFLGLFFVEVYFRHSNVQWMPHWHPVSFKTHLFSVMQISFPGSWEEPSRGKPQKAERRCREQMLLERTEKTNGKLDTEKRGKNGKMWRKGNKDQAQQELLTYVKLSICVIIFSEKVIFFKINCTTSLCIYPLSCYTYILLLHHSARGLYKPANTISFLCKSFLKYYFSSSH